MTGEGSRKPGRPKGGLAAGRAEATIFGHAISAIGMTHAEAAMYLDLSAQTIRYYATGARRVPDNVMERVATLWENVSFRADPGPLPYPAAKRREALRALRTRSWSVTRDTKEAFPPFDDIDGLE